MRFRLALSFALIWLACLVMNTFAESQTSVGSSGEETEDLSVLKRREDRNSEDGGPAGVFVSGAEQRTEPKVPVEEGEATEEMSPKEDQKEKIRTEKEIEKTEAGQGTEKSGAEMPGRTLEIATVTQTLEKSENGSELDLELLTIDEENLESLKLSSPDSSSNMNQKLYQNAEAVCKIKADEAEICIPPMLLLSLSVIRS